MSQLSSYDVVMKKMEIDDLPKAEAIEELLRKWRTTSAFGIRIVDNIKNDFKIDPDNMVSVLHELYAHRHLAVEEIETTVYRNICYKFALKGPTIELAKLPEMVGSAKAADDFVFGLASRMKLMGTKRAIELVSKLCSDDNPLTSAEEKINFTEFGNWITWSENTPADPFDFVTAPNELLKIVMNLGLAHRQEGMSHLLFVFSKSCLSEVFYPTIADANLYSYFKCTDSNDYCGRTQPWNPEEIEHRKLPIAEIKPRPEGVHKPIQLKDIEKPVRIIKGTKGTLFLV